MRTFKKGSIEILGAVYTVGMLAYDDTPAFKENNCDAWCNQTAKEIIIVDAMTSPVYKCKSIKEAQALECVWLRHEIIHAYLYESGLHCNSLRFEHAWAENEELVDWIAIQLPKIVRTCKELGVLS